MTKTGGTPADLGSPHVCTLKGNALNSGAHTGFDMSDTANSCTSAQSLVDTDVYTFAFSATDLAGNTADTVSHTNITFNSIAPTVTNVTSSTANGSYKAGDPISIQVTFSESVTVTGTPQLTLTTGTPATTAVNYSTGSGFRP